MYKNESYDFKQFRNEITNLEALDYSVPKSIKTKSVSLTSNKSKNIANEVSYLNLNIADTTSLKLIKGIGSVLAKRIVKFRNSLGGFYHENQLLQVYGLDSMYFSKFKHQLFVDSVEIKKIHINFVSAKKLSKHPYVNYKIAKNIVSYRNQHGYFNSKQDLYKLVVLDSVFINKIAPYLSFEDRKETKKSN